MASTAELDPLLPEALPRDPAGSAGPTAPEPSPPLPGPPGTPPGRGRLRLTLRATVLTLLIGIIGALSAVLIGTGWYYSTANARDLSAQLMDRLTRHVVDRTTGYLEPAATAARLSRELSRNAVIRADDWRQLERFFTQLLRAYPQLAMLNYGDERGDFLMVKRFPVATPVRGLPVLARLTPRGDLALRPPPGPAAIPTPPEAARAAALGHLWGPPPRLGRRPATFTVPAGSLSTKVIRRSGTPFVLWKYRDAAQRLRAVSIATTPDYDPRGRPWYVQSKRSGRQGWTGVYLFFTDQKPGLSSATPVFDEAGHFKAAVSVELELYRLSEFLATSKVGADGRVFIVSPDQEVVAYSEVDRLRRQVRRGGKVEWVLHRITEGPDPEVRDSFAALQRRERAFPPTRRHRFEVESGGRRWLAMYSPFPAQSGQRWTVGILVPVDAVLGRIEHNRRMNVLIALLVILGAILLAVVLSRAISRPLKRLVAEAERIQRLDLQGDVTIRSRLQEVDQLVTSMQQMKTGLRSFEKYVPRDLVRQLVVSGTEARVQGEKRELSILFSDIAGFTSLSEGLDPETLVTHLNRYFDAATGVLLREGATIDKYIGDAIMAFWGAPRRQTDHPLRACRAALALRAALQALNAQWQAEGHPQMHTRIGVHTGEAVVGNIGSDERLSYTLIGDSVNLASRIEGINKTYGTWITISGETYARVRAELVARALDVVAVKGRQEGVPLYELRCLREDASPAELNIERFAEEALAHYRAQRWDEAIGAWEALAALTGTEDEATAIMIRRCRAFRADPPPPEWDGTSIATTNERPPRRRQEDPHVEDSRAEAPRWRGEQGP